MVGRETGDEISGSVCGMSQQIRRMVRKKALVEVTDSLKLFLDEMNANLI